MRCSVHCLAGRKYSEKASCCDCQGDTVNSSLVDVCCLGGVGAWPQPPHVPLASLTRAHGIQTPRLKAVLTHSSSAEGPGHRRRYCPFRVRFADETLRDIALRYWERSCARKQAGWGAPGLQKVPTWIWEGRGCGPGSWEYGASRQRPRGHWPCRGGS